MSELKIINQQKVLDKDFKVYGDFDNPFFKASDVAEWIEYSKSGNGSYNVSQMLSSVDEDEKLILTMLVGGQNRQVYFLTEDGLYEVLMQSKKEKAKKFKKQVKVILRDVRRTGMYATDELLDNPDLLIQVATKLKEEKEKVKNLTTENKALIKQTFTWDFSSTVNALMRKYASSKGITFSKSWGCLYKEVKYKYGYDVKNRGGSGSMLSKFKEGEFADVIATASAMCSDLGIDVGKVTNEVNKENINT